ncbi:MAG: AI-2E family transporter [Micrococcales bacterium]|nr:MAG: AI-2E family transporter [Micrococcales bacterium]
MRPPSRHRPGFPTGFRYRARAASGRTASLPAANPAQSQAPPAGAGTRELAPVSYPVWLAASWSWRVLIIAAAVTLILWLIRYFFALTIPFFVALLLAALLSPLQTALIRLRVPRGLATAATILMALAAVLGAFTFIGTQIVSGFQGLSREVVRALESIQDWLVNGPLSLETAQAQRAFENLQQEIVRSDALLTSALAVTGTATSAVTGVLLTLFTLVFLLYDGRGIWAWVVSLLPKQAQSRVDLAGRDGWATLTSYVRATVVVAAADAAGVGIGAVVLQLPLAAPIAMLVFLGAFVPIVGAALSGAVAVLIALVTQGVTAAVVMLAIVLAVQQVEGHVLQPLLMGRAVSVHPLGVVLAVAGGLVVAGIIGAVFAVPVVAVLKTVVVSIRGSDGDVPAAAAGTVNP